MLSYLLIVYVTTTMIVQEVGRKKMAQSLSRLPFLEGLIRMISLVRYRITFVLAG
jgi:hypothetical protein